MAAFQDYTLTLYNIMHERTEYYCSAALRLELLQLQFTGVKHLSTALWCKKVRF